MCSHTHPICYLEANEETRPFADTYNQSLRDDEDEDFAYLGKESQIEEVLGESGADEAEEDDNEGEEAIETVDTQEIYEAVLQQAQEGVRVYSLPVRFYTSILRCSVFPKSKKWTHMIFLGWNRTKTLKLYPG